MVAFKLAINNLKRFFRENNAVWFFLFLPVVILTVVILYFNFDGGRITVMVADQANTRLTHRYIDYLKGNNQLSIQLVTVVEDQQQIDPQRKAYTEEYIHQLIKELRVNTFIKIPADFEEKFLGLEEIQLTAFALQDSQAQQTISRINDNYFTNLKALYLGSGQDLEQFYLLLEEFEQRDLKVRSQYTGQSKKPYSISFGLGILIYFILLASFKICKFAIEDKTSRVYYRIFTMPVRARDYILGYIISTFAIVLVQIGLNVLALVLLTKGSIPVVETVITLSIFSIGSIAISLLIIAVVNKESTIEIFTSGVVMFSSMLAGVFWPIDIMPDFMVRLARLFPQFWTLDLIQYLFYGGSIWDKKLNLIVLIGMIGFFLVTAIYFSRINDDLRDLT